jgi:two-component system OmpR family response regulator
MVRILVAEDDPTMASLVEEGLREEGYSVDVVTTGTDALIAATSVEYGAAAIDVMLPGMSGFELCRHLRAQGSTLPVLLLTARDAVEDRVFGLDAGADDYLTKPFAFAELSARIRALVRRESAAPRPVVRVGRVALDTATVRATLDAAPLTMSTKEFSLLRYLAVNAGMTVTRSQILQEVWGTTKHIDPTVVDQYVSYLRKKLEPVSPGFTITTARGVGYSLRLDESL